MALSPSLRAACPALPVPAQRKRGTIGGKLIVPLLLLHCACPELYGSLLINISDRFLTVKSAEKEIGKQDL